MCCAHSNLLGRAGKHHGIKIRDMVHKYSRGSLYRPPSAPYLSHFQGQAVRDDERDMWKFRLLYILGSADGNKAVSGDDSGGPHF